MLTYFHNKADTLKIVMTGSERLTGQSGRDGYKLINNYGLSETLGKVCEISLRKGH